MYLCVCNGLTETEVKALLEKNTVDNIDELRDLGVADNCCKCYNQTQELLIAHINEKAQQADNNDY